MLILFILNGNYYWMSYYCGGTSCLWMYGTSCYVLYGQKWIETKWIYDIMYISQSKVTGFFVRYFFSVQLVLSILATTRECISGVGATPPLLKCHNPMNFNIKFKWTFHNYQKFSVITSDFHFNFCHTHIYSKMK